MEIATPKIESSEEAFRFGDGVVARALGKPVLPICFQGKSGWLETHVIDAPSPALLSTNSFWKMDATPDPRDKRPEIRKLNMSVDLLRSSAGHLLLPVANTSTELPMGPPVMLSDLNP